LKIRKGSSKTINRKKEENTMANRTNNGAQKTTHKTEERATRTAGEGTQVLGIYYTYDETN
jgi:hypothetical protein